MRLTAFTDGASRGNPGDSGIGVILFDHEGNVLDRISGFLGTTTNNRAEYAALLAGIRLALKHGCTHLTSHSDSELLVKQMRGEYKVKDAVLRSWSTTIREVITQSGLHLEMKHVRREFNADADRLANEGIDARLPLPDPTLLQGLLFSAEQS